MYKCFASASTVIHLVLYQRGGNHSLYQHRARKSISYPLKHPFLRENSSHCTLICNTKFRFQVSATKVFYCLAIWQLFADPRPSAKFEPVHILSRWPPLARFLGFLESWESSRCPYFQRIDSGSLHIVTSPL